MKSVTTILLVDDDDIFRIGCKRILENVGFHIIEAADGDAALKLAHSFKPHIAFIDYQMPGMDGLELLSKLLNDCPATDAVMITGFATIETAVAAIQNGAYDYLSKPFDPQKLVNIANNIVEKQKVTSIPGSSSINLEFDGKPLQIIGNSPEMQRVFELVNKVAPTNSTVLILGESGTGKELIAKAIHANSLRSKKSYFAIDCGSLVETLLESELFGHIKGSFTGAVATKHGAFELAQGGSFFMDEIGNISLNVQAKILRAIQEKQIRRVGGTSFIDVNVRLITATNVDIRKAVDDGLFREDLYYRISVIPIYLPPLRNRKKDIPELIKSFIEKNNKKTTGKTIKGISVEAQEMLLDYHWPGNVRELENTIERAMVIADSDELLIENMPGHIREMEKKSRDELISLAEMESKYIHSILNKTNYNISRAAKILKIDRKTLYEKIKKYGLNK